MNHYEPLIKGPAHGEAEAYYRLGSGPMPKPTFASPLEQKLFPKHLYVGTLDIGGVQFHCVRRPNRFHRWMMYRFFGWKWEDKR